jgi:hypothetical protein
MVFAGRLPTSGVESTSTVVAIGVGRSMSFAAMGCMAEASKHDCLHESGAAVRRWLDGSLLSTRRRHTSS